MAIAESPFRSVRYFSPSKPTLKRINSAVLILRTTSQMRPKVWEFRARAREDDETPVSFPPNNSSTSRSLHSTHCGLRLMICSHAAEVSSSGTNKNDHDSVADVSSNLRNGGVQY